MNGTHPFFKLVVFGTVWTLLWILFTAVCFSANIVWEGDDSSAWTLGSNWTGGSKPGSADIAHFDGVLDNNCVLDGDAEYVSGIQVDVGYTGTIDFTDLYMTIGSDGLVVDGGTIDLGTSVITLTDGPWDVKDAAGWDDGNSAVILEGSCTVITSATQNFYQLTIVSGATVNTTVSHCDVSFALVINGTLDSNVPSQIRVWRSLSIGDGGRLTGSTCNLYPTSIGKGVVSFHIGGTWNINTFNIINPVDAVLVPGIYQSAVKINATSGLDRNLPLTASGDYYFTSLELETTSTGDVTLDANGANSITSGSLTFDRDSTGVITVDNSTGGVDWVLTGDVVDEGAATWTKGTGIITASGTGNKTWDLGSITGTLEDLIVNKLSGSLTFTGGWTSDSLDVQDGAVDFNGQTIVTTGNLTIQSGSTIAGGTTAMNGADITVGGTFTASGVSGTELDLLATAGWTIDATSGGYAHWVNVEYCNATAGGLIIAQYSTDGGNNTGWIFRDGALRTQMHRRRTKMVQTDF